MIQYAYFVTSFPSEGVDEEIDENRSFHRRGNSFKLETSQGSKSHKMVSM